MSELAGSLSVCPTKYTVNITHEFVNLCKLKCSFDYFQTNTAIAIITNVKHSDTEVIHPNAPGFSCCKKKNLTNVYLCPQFP